MSSGFFKFFLTAKLHCFIFRFVGFVTPSHPGQELSGGAAGEFPRRPWYSYRRLSSNAPAGFVWFFPYTYYPCYIIVMGNGLFFIMGYRGAIATVRTLNVKGARRPQHGSAFLFTKGAGLDILFFSHFSSPLIFLIISSWSSTAASSFIAKFSHLLNGISLVQV